jgi:hypothetical protein
MANPYINGCSGDDAVELKLARRVNWSFWLSALA